MNQPLTKQQTALHVAPRIVQQTMDEVAQFGDDKLQSDYDALESKMESIVNAAGDDFDLTCAAVVALDDMSDNANDNAAKFIEMHSKLAGYQNVLAQRHAAREGAAEFALLREQALQANIVEHGRPEIAESKLPSDLLFRSMMSRFDGLTMSDRIVADMIKMSEGGFQAELPFDPQQYLNETLTTSAGYPPFVTRQPGFTRAIQRPLQVIDTLPMASTMQHSIKYMIQTLRTSPSLDDISVAEGAASVEAAFAWKEHDEPMRELATHVPITELQMEDVAQIRAIVDEDLRMMVLQALDGELLIGPGTSDRILGLAMPRTIDGTVTNPLKYVWKKTGSGANQVRSDQLNDIKKAKTQLVLDGRCMPKVIYMHHEVWDEIALKETQSAGFYLGSPANDFVPMLWALPIVLTDHLSSAAGASTAINAIMVDTMYLRHWMRRAIHSEIGRINDQFIRRTWTIRAGLRCCVQVLRPQAVLTFNTN